MKLPTKSRHFHQKAAVILSETINVLIYVLLTITTIGIIVGVYQTGLHLYQNTIGSNGISQVIETLIIDLILMLALIEVFRIFVSYLTKGRVRVTLVVETVLIVMLNEIIRSWFEDKPHENILYLLVAASVLMVLRILAIRYSPNLTDNQKADTLK